MPLAQPAKRLLNDSVLREILRPDIVLCGRYPEQQHRLDPQRSNPIHLLIQRLVHGELEDFRHRGDLALHEGSVHDKERLNEVGRCQLVLANELTDRAGPAAAPRPVAGNEGHRGKTRERPLGPQPQPKLAGVFGTCFAFKAGRRTLFRAFTFTFRRV